MFIFRATNSQKAVNKYFHHDRFFSKKSHSTVGIAYYRSRWWWYDCWLLIQRDEKNDRRDRVFCCIYLSCLFIMANKYQAMQRKVFFPKGYFTFSLCNTIFFYFSIWKQDCWRACESYFLWGCYSSLLTSTEPYRSVDIIYFLYAHYYFLFSQRITVSDW